MTAPVPIFRRTDMQRIEVMLPPSDRHFGLEEGVSKSRVGSALSI
jgi:hypothetical protein